MKKGQTMLERLLGEMELLRPMAKSKGVERSLDRAVSWLKDLTAEPLTDEEQRLWAACAKEDTEANMDDDPEQFIRDTLVRSSTLEDRRSEARDYLKDWAEQMYNDAAEEEDRKHKWKALARLKPAEQAKWLRKAEKMILENADAGELA